MRRVAAAAAVAFVPVAAFAGAWTWPEGTGQAILSLSAGAGDINGQSGPGAARETRLESSLEVEYGLRDGLTGFLQSGLENEAAGAPVSDAYRGLDYSGAGLRARLFSSESLVWSVQGAALVPGAHDGSRPLQAGNTGFDSDWRTLVGSNFRVGAMWGFADASVGYRTRGGGPPDEWRADLTLGLHVRDNLTVMAQAFNAVSNGSRAPLFPAEQTMTIEPSVVYDFNASWSAQIGFYATLRAVNANREQGVIAAVWRRF